MPQNTILIIEDEESLSKIISFKLGKEGFNTLQAHDGEEGIDFYRKNKPNLILLDLIMAKLDGFGFLRQMSQELKDSHTPVLVMTNLSQPSDVDEVMKLGASDFIVKTNMSLDQLVDKVNGLVKAGA